MIDFLGKRKAILIFTVSVLVAGSIISAVRGVTLDTQFTGGVILKYTCDRARRIRKKAAKAVEGVLDRPVSARAGEDFVLGQEKLVLNLEAIRVFHPRSRKVSGGIAGSPAGIKLSVIGNLCGGAISEPGL